MHPPREPGGSAPDTSRVALFGGTFDPPHNGHIGIAKAAVSACDLDRILFLPCQISPLKHRHPAATPLQRMEMLELACSGIPNAEPCDWELNRPGPSYSWQTAEHFHRLIPPPIQLFWLMGSDQWSILDQWKRPDYLARLVTFIVFPRDGQIPIPRPWNHVFLDQQFAGSSTEVRRRIALGEPVDDLLPPAVDRYIRRNGLYQTGGIEKQEPG